MAVISRLALGLAAVLVAAPAFAECPGHSTVSAQTQAAPVPVAQSTPSATGSATAPADTVILTQNETTPTSTVPQE